MSPAEIEALIQFGTKLYTNYVESKAAVDKLAADNPEVYAEIARRHAAGGKRLDAAAQL